MTDVAHERVMEGATGASIAVATGANGAWFWSEEVKARIVAERFEEGATVAGVARRHGLSRTQLSGRRRLARDGPLGPIAGAGDDPFGLVPVTVPPAPVAEHGGEAAPPADVIAIAVADIRVVVRPGFDATHLSHILICVRDPP